MRILALDYGEKRIGVAVSDPLGTMALPVQTIDPTDGWPHFLKVLNELIAKYEIGQLVVGMPKTLKGEEGPQAQKVRAFIEKLKPHTPLPVVTWDERLSTAAVTRPLKETGLSATARRKTIDAQAAAFFLQGYLDAQKHLSEN